MLVLKPKYKFNHTIMKRILYITFYILLLKCSISAISQTSEPNFNRIDSYKSLTTNKVLHGYFTPTWIDNSNTFWYNVLSENGEKFYVVNAQKKIKRELIDVNVLISKLSELVQSQVNRNAISDIEPSENLKSFRFVYDNNYWQCALPKYKIIKKEPFINKTPASWSMAKRNELDNKALSSPNGKWKAFIRNYNLHIQHNETNEIVQLTFDGGIGRYYSSYLKWSPDSKKIMASLYQAVDKHLVNYLESSPENQIQPIHSEIEYYKPGDAIPQYFPRIFNIETKQLVASCDDLIPNQYSISNINWRNNSEKLTFEYNKRGHQVYQIIEMNAENGVCRVLINETQKTFINYSSTNYRFDINNGNEIIWASERDGWNHLYLYNGTAGEVKNQITSGNWVLRKVIKVDTNARRILFAASGKEKGDPYLLYYYWIDFDGSNMQLLTPENGNHRVSFSPDYNYLVDSWSRVDLPPTTVLRNAQTGERIMTLEEADISKLLATGWEMPEVFTTKGRDGETDIWGMFLKPSNFDPNKKYPVIEYIYAGPHSNHVPKDFNAYYNRSRQSLAELGFIVVMIDGMGTSNRSKAFHDVCWKNLKDAGFPDRILWMQDAAKTYTFMDISKVGIYGKSAGGQNSTGAVLFHPEFYKVAVSICGCHDNRMDKIWWNEQWMGWPVGPEYAASSNVDNAYRLQGDLMLVVGELDMNVDPASTYQVADALIKANKDFDFLPLTGKGHEWGGEYGERRICNFFVEKIMKATPPAMNSLDYGRKLIGKDIDK